MGASVVFELLTNQQQLQNVWTRKRRSQTSSQGTTRQHSRHHKARNPKVGKKRWCEKNFWAYLWRNQRSSQSFSGKCHQGCCHIHRTCQEENFTAMDVVYSLKRQGRTLYGFGG